MDDADMLRPKNVLFEQIVCYFSSYVSEYIKCFNELKPFLIEHFDLDQLPKSPYVASTELKCAIGTDGVIIFDDKGEPSYAWYIAGGPALKIDYEPTRTPEAVRATLAAQGLLGRHIGIFRLVSQRPIPDNIWRGSLPSVDFSMTIHVSDATISFYSYESSYCELLDVLTFGAFLVVNLPIDKLQLDFTNTFRILNLGFIPSDLNNRRFFSYLEMFPYMDKGAWDLRNIKARVMTDVVRDLGQGILQYGNTTEGSMQSGTSYNYFNILLTFNARLNLFEDEITRLKTLLASKNNCDENIYHEFLKQNPILLDPFGEIISKPRFTYPDNVSSHGKKYVEPDFIVKQPGEQYLLVELERPTRRINTKSGRPSYEMTQAAFQIGEWTTYIKRYGYLLEDSYPGITNNYKTLIVISRTTTSIIKNDNRPDLMDYVKNTFKCDSVQRYDMLLEANEALLANL